MARNSRVNVEELRDEFNENFEKLGNDFKAQLEEIRAAVQTQVEDVSSTIRDEADKSNLDKDARESIEKVLKQLEDRIAELDTSKLEEIEEDIAEEAKKHIWRNLFIVLVIGMIVGYFFSQRN